MLVAIDIKNIDREKDDLEQLIKELSELSVLIYSPEIDPKDKNVYSGVIDSASKWLKRILDAIGKYDSR